MSVWKSKIDGIILNLAMSQKNGSIQNKTSAVDSLPSLTSRPPLRNLIINAMTGLVKTKSNNDGIDMYFVQVS